MNAGPQGRDPALAGCRIIVSGNSAAHDPVSSRGAGTTVRELAQVLAGAGARVSRIAPQRLRAPAPAVLRRAVLRTGSGGVDAVVFASSAASWIAAAEVLGVLDTHRRRAEAGRLLLVTSDPADADGLHRAELPARRVADPAELAHAVVAHYQGGSASLPTDAGRLEVRSGGVVVDEHFIPLSRGGSGVIEALFLARGRVLSRAEIGRSLPGRERSGRAVEVAIARLRESLDGRELVQTVVKRGYRLAVTER
ncbi:winged helix-turn-helix domain-containing protein [Microbacterium sp. LB12]|uniref:winged helix-turn-helix domain-containing protein n=1 Tax=Microbacterium sp. LB12 TaxID=3081270 RepID=UPI0030181114